jgi:hypothetical protein
LEQINLDDGMWHMHFDGSCSNEGNGAGVVLISPVGKIHNFSYRLEFACTNNITEFEALLLGIENTYNLGCMVTYQFLGIPSLLLTSYVRFIPLATS